jgi:hypothetical protein
MDKIKSKTDSVFMLMLNEFTFSIYKLYLLNHKFIFVVLHLFLLKNSVFYLL